MRGRGLRRRVGFARRERPGTAWRWPCPPPLPPARQRSRRRSPRPSARPLRVLHQVTQQIHQLHLLHRPAPRLQHLRTPHDNRQRLRP
jgi:hypothetical protein